MNEKNLQFITLFALGYSLRNISHKQKVTVSTVRDRLHRVAKKYPKEFQNACGIRGANKRLQYSLKHPISLDKIADTI